METLNNKMLFYWGGGVFQAGMKIASIAIICMQPCTFIAEKPKKAFLLYYFLI